VQVHSHRDTPLALDRLGGLRQPRHLHAAEGPRTTLERAAAPAAPPRSP